MRLRTASLSSLLKNNTQFTFPSLSLSQFLLREAQFPELKFAESTQLTFEFDLKFCESPSNFHVLTVIL